MPRRKGSWNEHNPVYALVFSSLIQPNGLSQARKSGTTERKRISSNHNDR